ncbi:hypothetical protein FSP39_006728 [Pinctada imbricata]|uniref:Glycosyltransferase family 92 protein n=1 Tax=Pinctada imbricata TaxID=66713 RepID=A0AA88XHG0_PINIB|nr:hypothetical protein FSP39_006728 [Pinctada imbricata]
MIELNRILGANYFIFYNFSDAPNVDKLLKHYMDLGIAKVIQWHLPFNVSIGLYRKSNEIHYYGQVAVLNDCMYRNKGSSQFVVNQDIDEFIIPRMHNNWKQMIDALPKNLKSFIFQSTYFRKDWPDVNGTFDGVLAKKYMSITLPKQSRETGLFPVKIKSKYIVRPECVKIAGIHVVHQYTKVKKCQDYLVNVDQGLLHHYRSKVERVEVYATVDTRIENFKDKLLENLKEKWTELKHVPMTIPKTTTMT